VAGQSCEPRVDLPGFARSDPVDRRLHVIEDPTPRHAAQHPECLRQRIEQHLVCLERISAHNESPAVSQLGMGNLQLGLLAGDKRVILAPVELEGFTRLKCQRHEYSAPSGLLLVLPLTLPGPRKSCNPGV
jgi:hypothetical protein